MSITERQRAELYKAAEEKMGEGPAVTLLDQLREVMATKADLQSLRADVERSLREQTRTMLFGLASINLTFLAAALAGAHILGA